MGGWLRGWVAGGLSASGWVAGLEDPVASAGAGYIYCLLEGRFDMVGAVGRRVA